MLAYSISEKLYDGKMVTSLNENKNYDDFDEVYGKTWEDLTECEIEYRSHEIRYRLAKSFGYADNFLQERLNLCLKINSLLLGSKAMFMARCKKCGKRLPITHTGSLCPECELAEALNIKITSGGYTFTNKLADVARFKKQNRK